MSQAAVFATIFFNLILVNNYVLVQFLGICPFLGVSKKLDSSVGMGLAVIFVMVLATAVTFPLQIFLLDAYDLGYMQTVIFILVIAVLVQLIEITLKKYVPALYTALGVYLPLITTNCCVLGVTILAVQDYSSVVTEQGFGLAFAEAIKQDPKLELYRADKTHPSPEGTYLEACVVFASMYHRSPVGLNFFGIEKVDEKTARFLQNVAWDTVCEYFGWQK